MVVLSPAGDLSLPYSVSGKLLMLSLYVKTCDQLRKHDFPPYSCVYVSSRRADQDQQAGNFRIIWLWRESPDTGVLRSATSPRRQSRKPIPICPTAKDRAALVKNAEVSSGPCQGERLRSGQGTQASGAEPLLSAEANETDRAPWRFLWESRLWMLRGRARHSVFCFATIALMITAISSTLSRLFDDCASQCS